MAHGVVAVRYDFCPSLWLIERCAVKNNQFVLYLHGVRQTGLAARFAVEVNWLGSLRGTDQKQGAKLDRY